MKHRLLLAGLLVVGCAATPPPQGPTPAPTAEVVSPAPPAASSPSAAPAVEADPVSSTAWTPGGPPPPPRTGPRIEALEPKNPADGSQATARLAGMPADSEVEVWHMGYIGPFRRGVPHPSSLPDAKKLAAVTTDAGGRATFTFEVPVVFDDLQTTHVLWAVLPGGVILQEFHIWTSQFPTTIRGRVYDEAGLPVEGATITLVLGGGSGSVDGDFARSMRVRNGRYEFEDVPLPNGGSLTVRRDGWPERKRDLSSAVVIRLWAAMVGEFSADPLEQRLSAAVARGAPLELDFGGPGSAVDPAAPLYFFSLKVAERAYRTTAIAGRVFDDHDTPVPTSEGLVVRAYGRAPGDPYGAVTESPVRDGRYAFASVPTGVPITLALYAAPRCNLGLKREVVALPTAITGREAIFDFGGPGGAPDPEGPKFAYRRHVPGAPDPCASMPSGTAPTASAPIP